MPMPYNVKVPHVMLMSYSDMSHCTAQSEGYRWHLRRFGLTRERTARPGVRHGVRVEALAGAGLAFPRAGVERIESDRLIRVTFYYRG